MSNTVQFVNRTRGMFSVKLENGEYSVIEQVDTNEITVGDEIDGELDVTGSAEIENITTGDTFSVIIQNVNCSQHQAMNRVILH